MSHVCLNYNLQQLEEECNIPVFLALCDALTKLNKGDAISPLIIAAREGLSNLLFALLSDINDDDLNSLHMDDGSTVLMSAVSNGRLNTANILLNRNINLNAVNILKNTALHCAVQQRDVDLTNLLLEKGVDPNLKNVHGHNALMLSVIFDDINIFNILIKVTQDVNSKDQHGNTALHMACNKPVHNRYIIQYLINKGATIDFINLSKSEGGPFLASESIISFMRDTYNRHKVASKLCFRERKDMAKEEREQRSYLAALSLLEGEDQEKISSDNKIKSKSKKNAKKKLKKKAKQQKKIELTQISSKNAAQIAINASGEVSNLLFKTECLIKKILLKNAKLQSKKSAYIAWKSVVEINHKILKIDKLLHDLILKKKHSVIYIQAFVRGFLSRNYLNNYPKKNKSDQINIFIQNILNRIEKHNIYNFNLNDSQKQALENIIFYCFDNNIVILFKKSKSNLDCDLDLYLYSINGISDELNKEILRFLNFNSYECDQLTIINGAQYSSRICDITVYNKNFEHSNAIFKNEETHVLSNLGYQILNRSSDCLLASNEIIVRDNNLFSEPKLIEGLNKLLQANQPFSIGKYGKLMDVIIKHIYKDLVSNPDNYEVSKSDFINITNILLGNYYFADKKTRDLICILLNNRNLNPGMDEKFSAISEIIMSKIFNKHLSFYFNIKYFNSNSSNNFDNILWINFIKDIKHVFMKFYTPCESYIKENDKTLSLLIEDLNYRISNNLNLDFLRLYSLEDLRDLNLSIKDLCNKKEHQLFILLSTLQKCKSDDKFINQNMINNIHGLNSFIQSIHQIEDVIRNIIVSASLCDLEVDSELAVGDVQKTCFFQNRYNQQSKTQTKLPNSAYKS